MTDERPKQHRPGPDEAVPSPGAGPRGGRAAREERLDETVEETFPASDPPSFTPTDTSGSDSENRARGDSGRRVRDIEAEAVEDDLAEERERREEGSPEPLPRDVEGEAGNRALRDAADRRPDEQAGPARQPDGRSSSSPTGDEATADQLRDAIDDGLTGDKVPAGDPAAAPLGTDEEAAGTPLRGRDLSEALDRERDRASAHGSTPPGHAARRQPRGGFWQSMRRLFGGS